MFQLDRRHHCIRGTYRGRSGVPFQGVHKLIEEWYFPDFHPVTDGKRYSGRPAKWKTARRRGIEIDHRLEEWTLHGRPKTKKTHGFALAIMAKAKKRGLIPIASQELVGCTRARVATALDLRMYHPEKKENILWEVKSGHDTYFKNGNANMKPPLDDVLNSPLNQAYIQAGMTAILSRRCRPDMPIDRIQIVQSGYKGAKVYSKTPKWFTVAIDDMSRRLDEMAEAS